MILILWLQCDWMLEALEEVDEEQLSEEEEQQSWDQEEEGSPFPSLLQNPGMDELLHEEIRSSYPIYIVSYCINGIVLLGHAALFV